MVSISELLELPVDGGAGPSRHAAEMKPLRGGGPSIVLGPRAPDREPAELRQAHQRRQR